MHKTRSISSNSSTITAPATELWSLKGLSSSSAGQSHLQELLLKLTLPNGWQLWQINKLSLFCLSP